MRLREFFYFEKSDRSALIVLIIVALLALGLFHFLDQTGPTTAEAEAADSVSAMPEVGRRTYQNSRFVGQHERWRGRGGQAYGYDDAGMPTAPERFAFDPNTADSTQLLRLGLRPWMVRNIYRYRQRGGVYRRKQDFARLYGLTQKEYRELEPYIRISDDYRPAAELFGREQDAVGESEKNLAGDGQVAWTPKLKEGEQVALNMADTAELKRVPGIGSYFARQIVRYRQQLGGFVSKEQLAEIENFPTAALPYLDLTGGSIQRMNLNKLSLNELKRHPYVSFYQARAITDYRRLHGQLHSLDELRLLPEFPPEAIRRLQPYVEF